MFANDIKYVKNIKGATDKNGAKYGTCERNLLYHVIHGLCNSNLEYGFVSGMVAFGYGYWYAQFGVSI